MKDIIDYSEIQKNGVATVPGKIRKELSLGYKSELKWILKDGILTIKPLKIK